MANASKVDPIPLPTSVGSTAIWVIHDVPAPNWETMTPTTLPSSSATMTPLAGTKVEATQDRTSASVCAEGAYGMNSARVEINKSATRVPSSAVAARRDGFI